VRRVTTSSRGGRSFERQARGAQSALAPKEHMAHYVQVGFGVCTGTWDGSNTLNVAYDASFQAVFTK
jgi:hypothetical protein